MIFSGCVTLYPMLAMPGSEMLDRLNTLDSSLPGQVCSMKMRLKARRRGGCVAVQLASSSKNIGNYMLYSKTEWFDEFASQSIHQESSTFLSLVAAFRSKSFCNSTRQAQPPAASILQPK
jgi:hypothetical protein